MEKLEFWPFVRSALYAAEWCVIVVGAVALQVFAFVSIVMAIRKRLGRAR